MNNKNSKINNNDKDNKKKVKPKQQQQQPTTTSPPKRNSYFYCIQLKSTTNANKIETIYPQQCDCKCDCAFPYSQTRKQQNASTYTTTTTTSSIPSTTTTTTTNNYPLEGSENQCTCNCNCQINNNQDIVLKNNNNKSDSIFKYFKFSSCLCLCIGREFSLRISKQQLNNDNNKLWIQNYNINNIDNDNDDTTTSTSTSTSTTDKIYLSESNGNSLTFTDYKIELFLGVEKNGAQQTHHYHLCINELPLSSFINYQFYKNKIQSRPDGDYIDDIHKFWRNDIKKLEYHHGYVQWLFPLYANNGMNYQASKLERIEAKLFRNDIDIAKRIVESYEMMLNFYGIVLIDKSTGELDRHPDIQFSNRQFKNLSNNSHNNLRISRIITFLSHTGFKRYKEHLVNFLRTQIELNNLSISKYSLNNYWLPLIDYSPQNLKSYFETTFENESDLAEDSIYFHYLNFNNNNNNNANNHQKQQQQHQQQDSDEEMNTDSDKTEEDDNDEYGGINNSWGIHQKSYFYN